MKKLFKNRRSGYTHTPPPTRLHTATGINNTRSKNMQIKPTPSTEKLATIILKIINFKYFTKNIFYINRYRDEKVTKTKMDQSQRRWM